jgi:hypothetical protein
MPHRNIVRLKIFSHSQTPEEISEFLGVSCDECWKKGQFRPQTIIVEKYSVRMVHTKPPERESAKGSHYYIARGAFTFCPKNQAAIERNRNYVFSRHLL